MVKIVWSDEAVEWLQDIYEYIAKENPSSAKRVIKQIYERVQILQNFPQIGYRYEKVEVEVRILLYGHYRIAYLYEENRQTLTILGIFHGALAIERYL